MDEPQAVAPIPPDADAPPPVRDRGTALALFGCLQIVLALGALFLLAAVIYSRRFLPPEAAKASPLAIQVVVWGGVAAVFLALGVGSIRARRWARILTLVVSGCWAVFGVLSGIALAIFLPGVFERMPTGGSARPVLFVMGSFLLVFGVLLPLAFLVFYARRDVAATCEARDGKPGFADRVPLVVLVLTLLYGFTAVMTLATAFFAVLPYPGGILTGPPAAAISVLSALLSAAVAWGIYGRRVWAWGTAVGLSAVGTLYGVLTYSRIDPDALYRAQGYDPGRMHSGTPDLLRSPVIWIGMFVWGLLYLVFLLWARRYFPRPAAEPLPITPGA
jgi:hypothetical protein